MKRKRQGWAALLGSIMMLVALPAVAVRSDVLVVVNDNSADSVAVGNYYALRRAVPEKNIVHVRVPNRELVSWSDFVSLRNQILLRGFCPQMLESAPAECGGSVYGVYTEAAVEALRNGSGIRYVVLTKGVPARMNQAPGAPSADVSHWYEPAAVDAYLRIMLANYLPSDTHLDQSERRAKFIEVDADSGVFYPRRTAYANVVPMLHREYVIGRLDGVSAASAMALVDRAPILST